MADTPKGDDLGGLGGTSNVGKVAASTFNDLGGAVADIYSYMAAGYKEQALAFEEQNYEAAAALARQNEQFTETSTKIKEQQADRELYQSLGRTTAAVAGAGLDLSGSSLDILRQSAGEGAATRAVIGEQGLITEAGYAEQEKSYQNMASAARVAESAEKTAQVGDLIGGGLKLAGAVASLL